MSMWLHAVWEVKRVEIFVWSGWDNAEGSCETEQTIKQQNKFMDNMQSDMGKVILTSYIK